MGIKKSFKIYSDEEVRACMIGYVLAKQDEGVLISDMPIDNMSPKYLDEIASICMEELTKRVIPTPTKSIVDKGV